ncbi:MAG: FtsW/RodA/SpoVE family cell cycle protein [Ruminococcus sp.]|nr:FtsW/RodA/SpoVE family cell cycle protein [Ruminococcus sp.]MCD7800927.1 FtsW/RodA/SpoVE family cell cycle protein [Ruminococcus sp.]
MATQSKIKVHYFWLTVLILMSHVAMLGVVFFKGNYETLMYPIILSAFVILSDIVYSGIIKSRKQSVYIVDYMMLFILNMSIIFQSCFGEVSFSYKQAILSILALICCEIGCKVALNYEKLEKKKTYIYILAGIIILSIVFLTGSRSMWIDLGFITIQPSEFLKPVYVILCATTLSMQHRRKTILKRFKYVPDNIILLILTVIIFALQWWCRDLGSLPTFMAVAFCAFISRICYPETKFSKKNIIILCVIGVIGVVCALIFAPSYVQDRLNVDIWADQSGSGYQQCKALIAIAEGGWFGKGAGYGTLHNVAAYDTDIVFSAICEEWGFFIGIMAVLSIVIMLCTSLINTPRSYYHSTLVAGVVAVFIAQMSLNIFGSCNLIPFTGVTIPFISMGGSSMLSSGLLVGFLKASQIYEK